MSVDEPIDVQVDLDEDGSARAVITERRELEIDDLFDGNGELRLWEDGAGWNGYVREEIEDDVVIYHHVNTRFDADRWIDRVVGEQAVREAVRKHIRDPLAGGAGTFRRGVLSAMSVQKEGKDDVVDEPSGAHLQVESAKGGHHREPPLATSVGDTMTAYVDVAGVEATDPVVDVSKRTVERWVGAAAADRHRTTGDGSWSFVTPHDLRRSWATLLLEAGVEPGMVMEWGGWRNWAAFRDHYLGEFSPAAVSRERDKVGWLWLST